MNACAARARLVWLYTLSVIALTACGFALRSAPLDLPVKELQLQIQANSYVGNDLKQYLKQRGVKLNIDPQAKVPRVGITAETKDRSVLTTNSNGRVREYQLKHSLTVQVWDGQGRVWLAPVTFTQSRDLSYDENKVLAKETEELAMYKDMQAELLLAIIRRLEGLRTVAPPQ